MSSQSVPGIAAYLQSGSYSAYQDRVQHYGRMIKGISAKSGVVASGWNGAMLPAVVAAPAVLQVQVDRGSCQVGEYLCVYLDRMFLTIDPPTTTARRDLIIARVYDQEQGDAASQTVVEIVKGTSAADPTIPVRSMVLAHVTVPASSNAITVTDRRQFTVAAGGVVPLTASELGANQGNVMMAGTLVHNMTEDRHYRVAWDGSVVPLVPTPANISAGFSGQLNFNQDALAWAQFPSLRVITACVFTYTGPYALYAYPYQLDATNSALIQLCRVSNGDLIPNQIHSVFGVAWGPPA